MPFISILCDENKIGTFKQLQALANGLRYNYSYFAINLPKPWCYFPPQIFNILPKFIKNHLPTPAVPKNSWILAAGRQAILCSLKLRYTHKTIVLLNPKVKTTLFNLVIAPFHDRIKKNDNLVEIIGSLCHEAEKLEVADCYQTKELRSLDHLRLGILLGGNNKKFTYNEKLARTMAAEIQSFITKNNIKSVMVTPSRRTPQDFITIFNNLLRPNFLWQGNTPNPYNNFLQDADILLVTSDSISMISEACSSGKIVLVYDLKIKNKKFSEFLSTIYQKNYANPLSSNMKLPHNNAKLQELVRIIPLVKNVVESEKI